MTFALPWMSKNGLFAFRVDVRANCCQSPFHQVVSGAAPIGDSALVWPPQDRAR
jgi:hypothetical protein